MTKMKKTLRILYWLIYSGLFMAMLFFGYEREINGLRNLALFCAWFHILISPFLWVKDICLKAKFLKINSLKWMNLVFDIIIVGIFIWYGAIVTGIFYFFHMLIAFTAYSLYKAYLKENLKEKRGKNK